MRKIKRYNRVRRHTLRGLSNSQSRWQRSSGRSLDDRPSSDVERRARSYQRRRPSGCLPDRPSPPPLITTGGHHAVLSRSPARPHVTPSYSRTRRDRTQISIGRLCRLFVIFTTVTRPSLAAEVARYRSPRGISTSIRNAFLD